MILLNKILFSEKKGYHYFNIIFELYVYFILLIQYCEDSYLFQIC